MQNAYVEFQLTKIALHTHTHTHTHTLTLTHTLSLFLSLSLSLSLPLKKLFSPNFMQLETGFTELVYH